MGEWTPGFTTKKNQPTKKTDPKMSAQRVGAKHRWVPQQQWEMVNHNELTVYPLVNVNKKLWKDPPFFMVKLTISMVIFNSYVKLPEGIPH